MSNRFEAVKISQALSYKVREDLTVMIEKNWDDTIECEVYCSIMGDEIMTQTFEADTKVDDVLDSLVNSFLQETDYETISL